MSECIQQKSVTMESVVKAKGSCISTVILLLLLFSVQLCSAADKVQPLPISRFNRSSFPPDFVFGDASAAYQNEGAAFEGGKGPSIWDTFAHKHPEKITDGTNGDVANDFYHRYKEDVKLMKYVGLDAYRMSISWSRILPSGKLSGGVNKEGVAFYNNVFNELLANGITPFVTLFHWDTPQALEDEYQGFLSPHIIDDFKDFVNVCFKEFGDRIKHWITINEPLSFTSLGYDGGTLAPGRCSNRTFCPEGNSATEPYIVGHHFILCHATAVKLYRHKYKGSQKGEIGIALDTFWFLPYSNTILDTKATQRVLDFRYGWFMEPIVFGDYPKIMRSIVGDRLPKFTKEETAMVKGSIDFLGLNYYTGAYVRNVVSNGAIISNTDDRKGDILYVRNGVAIGAPTGSESFYVYPQGLHDLLIYTKEKYNNPKIYITENGYGAKNNGTTEQSISDPQRIAFYHDHLQAAQKAILEGVNLKGFIAWSFTDVYEWSSGFTVGFGLVYVDRKNGLKRTPKRSAIWFKKFLNK